MPFDAFISYSSKDKLVADAACAALEARGVRCWIAPRDIMPGEEWPAAIIKGIANSRLMVLIYSGSANASPQIKRELERAVHANMPILPYRIEAAPMSPSLQYLISTPHWLDAIDPPMEENLKKLGDTVEALLAGLGSGATGATASTPQLNYRTPSAPPKNASARGALVVAGVVLALGFAGFGTYRYVQKLAQPTGVAAPAAPAAANPPGAAAPGNSVAQVTPPPATVPAAATTTLPPLPNPTANPTSANNPAAALARIRAEALEAQGDVAMSKGEYKDAMTAYDSALVEDPGLIRVAPKRQTAYEAYQKVIPPTTPPKIDPANPPRLEPLIFAAVGGNNLGGVQSIVQWKKTEVASRDSQGRTPLHAVAANPQGTWQIARLLLDNGADHTARDNDGRTPMDLAKASGNTRVKAILEQILTTRPSK